QPVHLRKSNSHIQACPVHESLSDVAYFLVFRTSFQPTQHTNTVHESLLPDGDYLIFLGKHQHPCSKFGTVPNVIKLPTQKIVEYATNIRRHGRGAGRVYLATWNPGI